MVEEVRLELLTNHSFSSASVVPESSDNGRRAAAMEISSEYRRPVAFTVRVGPGRDELALEP